MTVGHPDASTRSGGRLPKLVQVLGTIASDVPHCASAETTHARRDRQARLCYQQCVSSCRPTRSEKSSDSCSPSSLSPSSLSTDLVHLIPVKGESFLEKAAGRQIYGEILTKKEQKAMREVCQVSRAPLSFTR